MKFSDFCAFKEGRGQAIGSGTPTADMRVERPPEISQDDYLDLINQLRKNWKNVQSVLKKDPQLVETLVGWLEKALMDRAGVDVYGMSDKAWNGLKTSMRRLAKKMVKELMDEKNK